MNETAAVIKGPWFLLCLTHSTVVVFFFFLATLQKYPKYEERPNQELNSRALH